MKKTNNKVSQHKIKRAAKNKKRIAKKPYFSKFERQQIRIREDLLRPTLQLLKNSQE